MQQKVKFCPRCGTRLSISDTYCIKCGYNFAGRARKRTNLYQIIIAVLILAGAWVAIRLILKKPIIPQEVLDLIKIAPKIFPNKTG